MSQFARAYIITVVGPNNNWRRATAAALVREVGIPVSVAARWAIVRRELSTAGLKRKLKEQVN